MKPSNTVIWLAGLIAPLALIATLAGLFWPAEGSPFSFTTLRGETVQIYGQGLYRYDTPFSAAGFQGSDLLTLLAGIPLLIFFTWRYRRGSLRGGLLLLGTLGYFLYLYASLALKAAYNPLFLLYIALFSASLFAFVRLFGSFDRQMLPAHFLPGMPRRGPAVFMVASGLVTLVVWLEPLVSALLQHRPPVVLASYTTTVTDVLDLGIITPATFIAGSLIFRRDSLGYLIACSLLILEIMLAPMIGLQTLFQISAGVTYTPAEIIGPMGGFVILGLLAFWVLATILRHISDAGP